MDVISSIHLILTIFVSKALTYAMTRVRVRHIAVIKAYFTIMESVLLKIQTV